MVLPGRRRVLTFVLLALMCAGAGSLLAYGPRRAARVAKLVWLAKRDRTTLAHLKALGRDGRGLGVVQGILERYVGHKDEEWRRAALKALVAGFPESPSARAVKDYTALTGDKNYFEGSSPDYHFSRRGAAASIPLP